MAAEVVDVEVTRDEQVESKVSMFARGFVGSIDWVPLGTNRYRCCFELVGTGTSKSAR